MVNRGCTTCVYAWWEPGQWLASLSSGFPSRPVCANHPDAPGRMKMVPFGGPCRNFRLRAATPDGDVKQLPLGGGVYAYVDAADYKWASKHKWSCLNGYAGRHVKGKAVYLHRLIMKPPKGKIVDHSDGNRLNDCRSNLRNCTGPENACNRPKYIGSSSQYRGVYYCKRESRYYATIRFAGKLRWLGYYDDEVEAARVYDRKAVDLGIEFARLNFPEEWPPERREAVHALWQKENRKGDAKRRKAKAGSVKRHAKAPARKRPMCKAKRTAGRARRKAVAR